MTEIIPYFAGFVTLVFGIAFYLSLQEMKKAAQQEAARKNKANTG